tara:strand:+ start:186 stop:899 length:714 start_codon:yes stop_codon:yes gene_type:complete
MSTPLYITSPNFIERHEGIVDLSVSNRQLDSQTKTVRFVGARALTAAPPNQSTLFTVPVSGTFRSPSLRRNRANLVEENNRGLTRASFDPDDYAGANFHGEGAINFIKVEEVDGSGTETRESGWLVIPPPNFFASGRRTLNLNGLAPQVATPATYSGLPPLDCLVVKMPKYADSIQITNTSSNPLFFSLGAGHQEMEIPAGESYEAREAGASIMFFRATGGTATFTARLAIVNGIEA